jgi:hypothetical protein
MPGTDVGARIAVEQVRQVAPARVIAWSATTSADTVHGAKPGAAVSSRTGR